MKKVCFGFLAMVFSLVSVASYAQLDENTVRIELVKVAPMKAGADKEITIRLVDNRTGKPVKPEALQEVHTHKIHLMAIDESLEDYHHIYPESGKAPGEYIFYLTPKNAGSYRVWADITPVASGQQEYPFFDVGGEFNHRAMINKVSVMTSQVEGYTFSLILQSKLRVGKATVLSVVVSKDGKPVMQLEPIMGAYAHLVGFAANHNALSSMYPSGNEPKTSTDRGGPKLEFPMTPARPGVIKMFIQVHVDGRDITAPLTVWVAEQPMPNAQPLPDGVIELQRQ